jgi:hypothetical protein
MIEPRMPEVGASPLLNRKVVDKPIVDPLLLPQNEPQQVQQPQPQAQPQAQPSQKPPFNPLDFEKDASTERLTQPQTPLDDPSIRSMTFDEMIDKDTGGGSGSGGGGGGAGESPTMQLPKGEAKAFAKLMVQIGSAYVPMLCVRIASVNIAELEMLEAQGIVPPGSANLFRRMNAEMSESLQITEDEQKMLYDALKAYLEWKNIEAANPGTALAVALGVIAIRLSIETVSSRAEMKAMYNEFLKKNYAPAADNVTVEEETKQQEEA